MLARILACVIVSIALAPACSSPPGGPQEDEIVFGGIFADDIDEMARRDLYAAQLAIEEINASAVFDGKIRLVSFSPARGDSVDPDKAAAIVRDLHDQHGALAFMTGHGADASYRMIEVTNSEPYSSFVRCSSKSTEPGSNIPGMYGADETDTFYRTVVTYNFFFNMCVPVFFGHGWLKIGLYRTADISGDEASLGLRMLVGSHADEGFSFAFDRATPPGEFDVQGNKPTMDEIIGLSRSGEVDATVMGVFQAQLGSVVKYFSENGYQGCLFLSTPSTTADLFDIATNLDAWRDAGNTIMGVEPDNYAGKNSQEFVSAFRAKTDLEPAQYTPNSYDCAYTLALSLLYAGDDRTREGIKEGIRFFKEENRTPGEVEVGIGTAEFRRAAQLIREGKRIDFEGASGQILFDTNGDRPKQHSCFFRLNDTATGWTTGDCYDPDGNPL